MWVDVKCLWSAMSAQHFLLLCEYIHFQLLATTHTHTLPCHHWMYTPSGPLLQVLPYLSAPLIFSLKGHRIVVYMSLSKLFAPANTKVAINMLPFPIPPWVYICSSGVARSGGACWWGVGGVMCMHSIYAGINSSRQTTYICTLFFNYVLIYKHSLICCHNLFLWKKIHSCIFKQTTIDAKLKYLGGVLEHPKPPPGYTPV